jgi:hypothetical protein
MHQTLVLAICYGLFKSRDRFFWKDNVRALVLRSKSFMAAATEAHNISALRKKLPHSTKANIS